MPTKFSSIQHLLIKVSDICNLHCSYCYEKDSLRNGCFKEWDELTESILTHKIPLTKEATIKFTGGEPLINTENLIKGIKTLYKALVVKNGYKIHFGVSTNGYFPEEFNNLTRRKLIDSRYCWVSWDGLHSTISRIPKKEFNKTPVSDYIVLENLKKIEDKNLLVRIAVTKDSKDHLLDSIKWLYENGFTKCEYYFLYDYSDVDFFQAKREFQDLFTSLVQFQSAHYGVFTITNIMQVFSLTKDENVYCAHIGKMLYIDHKGYLYPCQMCSPDYPEYEKLCISCLLGTVGMGLNYRFVNAFIADWDHYIQLPNQCKSCGNLQCYQCPVVNRSLKRERFLHICNIRSMEWKTYTDPCSEIAYFAGHSVNRIQSPNRSVQTQI